MLVTILIYVPFKWQLKADIPLVVTIVYYFILRMTQRKNAYSMSGAMATLHDLSIVNSTHQDGVLCLCFTKCKPSHVECSNNSVNGK